jgi:LysM repeat protein
MTVLGQRYVVVKGDNLWDIAKRHLGGGSQWPRIWRYNNRRDVKKITGRGIPNPDLIYVGQVLLIPDIPGTPKPAPKDDSIVPPNLVPAQEPTINPPPPTINPPHAPPPPTPSGQQPQQIGPLERQLPTIESPISFKYRLDDIRFPPVDTPTALIEFRMTGDILLMSKKRYPALYVTSRREIEAQVTQEMNNAFGKLIDDNRFIFDPVKRTVTVRSMLVSQIQTPYAPAIGNTFGTAVGVEMSSNNPIPKLRAEIRTPWFQGTIGQFLYVAMEVKYVIEITPKPGPPAGPGQQPAQVPGTNWARVIGIGLVTTAIVIVVATVVEDFFTAGFGVADDPASFAVAATTMARGLAMIRGAALPAATVPATVTIGTTIQLAR